MKTILLSAITLAGWAGMAAANDFGPLLAPAQVQEATAPLILDIREEGFDKGHIEGAVSAPYSLFRGPASNPGELIPEDKLEATLRDLGVTYERPTLIVHQGKDDSDFGAAARVYWTLKSSGVSQIAILNGGMNAWRDAGLAVTTQATAPQPSDIDITFSDQWLATEEDVNAVVGGEKTATLVDARPPAFFEGKQAHPSADRPGTLPGAENVPHSVWFDGTPRIGDATNAKEIAARLGLNGQEEVVSFCNTGHWASTEWFALSELAGLPNVKLYPESVVGYSHNGGEMANVPGLMDNLLRQIRGVN
ncbi:sulfurtransferase [Falsirhodobacter deserti]|uniref:sulfurtransferase n=1 Tax=Falsirhodobacter deserti TaxID=1365611 RepID=UPI000FE3E4B4|nr:rhodanese-like domain-containing protein [Falsirhodobacter deserti]